MSEQLEKMQKDMEQALTEFRSASKTIEELEKKGAGVAELKEKVEKADKALESYDKKNQEMVEAAKKGEKEAEEMKAQIAQLEKKAIKLASMGVNVDDEKSVLKAEQKAAELFMCKSMNAQDAQVGQVIMNDEEKSLVKKYLSTDNNANGGFLVEAAYDDMIIKPITEMDPMRSVCRIKRVDANSLKGYLRASLMTSYWTGEGETFTEGQSRYAQPEIPVHSVTTKTLITNRELLASKFNMDNEIMGDARESSGQLVGASYVNGDGVKRPKGFLSNAVLTAAALDGGGSSTFDYDDLIDLSAKPKAAYNCFYGMNRTTLAHCRKLQDGAGGYIFEAGDIKGGIPNQIAGAPFIIIPSMPDIATNAYPVVYADFMKLYTIVDSWQAILLRNPYKVDGQVQFSMEAWFGGDVVLPEAGALLKTVA